MELFATHADATSLSLVGVAKLVGAITPESVWAPRRKAQLLAAARADPSAFAREHHALSAAAPSARQRSAARAAELLADRVLAAELALLQSVPADVRRDAVSQYLEVSF